MPSTFDMSRYNDSFLNLLPSETIYYDAGGTTTTAGATEPGRAITALIDRQPAISIPDAPGGIRPTALSVLVENDASAGISIAELDCGSDTLRIRRLLGGAYETFTIARQRIHDSGMIELECL